MMWFNAAENWGAGTPMVDGVTDNSPQIRAAQAAAEANGGGKVYLPATQYPWTMTRLDPASSFCIYVKDRSNIRIVGDGPGLTVLRQAPDQRAHTICFEQTEGQPPMQNCGVDEMTVDGNKLEGNDVTGPHALRTIGYQIGFRSKRLHLMNSHGYGWGAQAGRFEDFLIEDLLIENTGADGMDWKNRTGENKNNRMRNVIVRNFGQRAPDPLNPTSYAGLDLRGLVDLDGAIVEGVGQGLALTGVRLRPGELTDVNGLGGHQSKLRNLKIRGTGSAGVGLGSYARAAQISGLDVIGCEYVGVFAQYENQINHIRGQECTKGLWFRGDLGYTSKADRCMVTDAILRSITDACAIVDDADEVTFNGFTFRSSGTGFRIAAAAAKTQLLSGCMSASVTTPITDLGLNTRIRAVNGLADKN